jgi:dephospho-CoA kinase
MRQRGMSEASIRARIDAQAPLEDKAEAADFLVENEGTLDELESQVERLWNDLSARSVA